MTLIDPDPRLWHLFSAPAAPEKHPETAMLPQTYSREQMAEDNRQG